MRIDPKDLDALREILAEPVWKARLDALLRRSKRILRVEGGSIALDAGELSWSQRHGSYVVTRRHPVTGIGLEPVKRQLLPAVLSIWLAVRAGRLSLDEELQKELREIDAQHLDNVADRAL